MKSGAVLHRIQLTVTSDMPVAFLTVAAVQIEQCILQGCQSSQHPCQVLLVVKVPGGDHNMLHGVQAVIHVVKHLDPQFGLFCS